MSYCPYCAQGNTHKDPYGYCRVYSCFEVSGHKEKFLALKQEYQDSKLLPTLKRNMFDHEYKPYRRVEQEWIIKKITNLMGFVPLEVL